MMIRIKDQKSRIDYLNTRNIKEKEKQIKLSRPCLVLEKRTNLLPLLWSRGELVRQTEGTLTYKN
jgi:hypothetical protein